MPPKAAAPPQRMKPAAPSPAAPAPAPMPSRPAPAVAERPMPQRASETVRASDTASSANPFNFDVAASTPAQKPIGGAPSSAQGRRPAKKNPNTGLFIALAGGGGLLVVALVIGLVVAMSGSGDNGKREIADAKTKAAKTKTIATKGKKAEPVEDKDTGGLLDRPRERPRAPVEVVAAKPREAASLEEVVEGVVKIMSPGLTGTSQGTGFIINEKGWIATNCHVIDDATDQTKVIIKGSEYKVAGLVIKAKEHDMAIIKLAEQPFQLTVLDITYSQNPKLASKVRAIGFPSDTFNLTEGIVSNVCTVDGLTNQGQKAFLRSMNADPNHLWIQHSAKISPGNSGGPLLNEANQVVGINTWVSSELDIGYAGHINHLRDLIAKASDSVTPFPKGVGVEIASGDELYNIVFTADRVAQLIGFCEKFQWRPTTVEQFDGMAELAKLITFAKMAPGGRVPADMKAATDNAMNVISKLSWDADQVTKVNKFAAESTDKPLHGIIFVATMIEPDAKLGENATADRLKLEGLDHHVIVKAPSNKALGAKDVRFLIIGLNTPTLISKTDDAAAQRLIVPGFSRELK
jgi:S1-C subfamily serine protease